MLADFKTPEKPFQDSLDYSSSTVKRAANQIFSNSTRSQRGCRSERRYASQNPNPLDQIAPYTEDLEPEIKSNKLLTFDPHHTRKVSHTRQKSIGDYEDVSKLTLRKEASTRNTSKVSMYTEDSRSPCFVNNASDTESVIHVVGEKKKSQFMQGKENVRESVGKSLQVLDSSPCCIYCRFCKLDVHSSIEYYNTRMSGGFLRVFSSIFTCCSGPLWLSNMKVHKCPNCSLVLAKCR